MSAPQLLIAGMRFVFDPNSCPSVYEVKHSALATFRAAGLPAAWQRAITRSGTIVQGRVLSAQHLRKMFAARQCLVLLDVTGNILGPG